MKSKVNFKSFLVNSLITENKAGHLDFDSQLISSKLKTLEKQSKVDDTETTGFVIEDEEGGFVKVWVRNSQARAFEQALGLALSDESINNIEIAELLFELRRKFDIIDVNWPTFKEDEEQQPEVAADETSEVPEEPSEEEPSEEEPSDEMSSEEEPSDEIPSDGSIESDQSAEMDSSNETTLLQHILQMMSADAEAKKAEADARRAEAEAKAAEYAALAMEKKVKDEEQLLDIERIEKTEKDSKKYAEKLAKLAKYRYDLRRGKQNDKDPSQ